MDLNSVPGEILFQIFGFLDQNDLMLASQVSTKWNRVAFEPRLWKKIIFGDGVKSSIEAKKILSGSFLVKEIKFVGVLFWDWIDTLPQCQNLRRFEFDSCEIDNATVSKLIRQFPLITSVKLSNDKIGILSQIVKWKFLIHVEVEKLGENQMVLENVVEQCVENCRYLRQLDVGFYGFMCLKYFRRFSKIFGPNVTQMSLNCDQCYDVDHTILRRFSNIRVLKLFNVAFLDFIKKLDVLQELHITRDNRSKCQIRPNKHRYIELFHDVTFQHLSTVHLKNCDIDDVGLRHMSLSCPNLKILELSYCKKITDQGLNAIFSNCRSLENLYLTGLDGLSLSVVVDNLSSIRRLTCLYVNKCIQITKAEITLLELVLPRIMNQSSPRESDPTKNEFKIEF